tara:strand:- start:6530 stop:7366 length:837 start_codon:yes stop_codon:yes gene_type:complete
LKIRKISSSLNSSFKNTKKIILQKKYRDIFKKFWVEGEKTVKTFITCSVSQKLIFCVRESAFQRVKKDLLTNRENIEEIRIFADDLYSKLSQVVDNSTNYGILLDMPIMRKLEDNLSGNIVYLHNLQDPGNLGTIIRICAAVESKELLLSKKCVDPWSPKVIRAASGGHLFIRIRVVETIEQLLTFSKKRSFPIIAASTSGKTNNFYHTEFSSNSNIILAFGSEGNGLPHKLLKNSLVQKICIPHRRELASINVSSALAVVMFELHRRKFLDVTAIKT